MIKRIKAKFSLPIEEKYNEEFLLENLIINASRAKLVIIVTFFLEVAVIITFYIYHLNIPFTENSKYYSVMYAVFLMFSVLFYFLIDKLQSNPKVSWKSKLLTIGYLVFILLWNMGIALMDGAVTAYIVALMAVALIGVFKPAVLFVMLSFMQAVFFVLIPFFQQSTSLFASYINSSIALAVALVAGNILFKNRVDNFKSHKEVGEKTKALQELNVELNKANKKLEYLAQTDGLTGIFNRRMFDKLSMVYWEDSLSLNTTLSVVMIDIDYFKRYNDTYGHQCGDDCLKIIVAYLKKIIPAESMLARYGGEEFSILIKGYDEKEAFAMAEEIRKKIADLNIEHKNSRVKPHVTLSLGVYTGQPNEKNSITEFISHADKALYKAKDRGRDLTVIA